MWVQYDMNDVYCLCCIHVVINFITFLYLVISQGKTPLHRAADNSSDACCKALLDHNADIEAKDSRVSV